MYACGHHSFYNKLLFIFYFLKILFIFRERAREGESKGEKHWSSASHMPPTGDLACNPGMCPDQESNPRPFGLQVGTQSIEPQQPGLILQQIFTNYFYFETISYLQNSCKNNPKNFTQRPR